MIPPLNWQRLARLPWLIAVLCLCIADTARAHVGNPHIIFEGNAGSVPLRVVIRQPDVVPGLAEISLRVLSGQPTELSVLPLHWNTDRKGAPRPDKAQLVSGETNLYAAQLWFMSKGAYGVEVTAAGPGGGSIMIPVNSMAFERKPMPFLLAAIVSVLGVVLIGGLLGIARAALKEGTLVPGAALDAGANRRAWIGTGLAIVVVLIAVVGGNAWWAMEDEAHRTRVLYRPLEHQVEIGGDAKAPTLTLTLSDRRMSQKPFALVPDHGKLMHVFLVNADAPSHFLHLHPERGAGNRFESKLPDLPAGQYRVYADVTHELGFSETLTNTLSIPATLAGAATLSDSDDGAWEGRLETGSSLKLDGGRTLQIRIDSAKARAPAVIEARFQEADGTPCTLEPYMRMLGHAVIMRLDGSVFSHVHPGGTLNMAAAKKFASKAGGTNAVQATEAVCGDLSAMPEAQALALGKSGKVGFPFVFPSSGSYAVWIQTRISGKIVTGAFQIQVP